ncbi:MAG TPA: tetratricopeptide repeat protein [Candidatus Brocadiaceae bacterium]
MLTVPIKGQYNRAIKDCNKAIALDPNDATAYIFRGSAYF